MVRTQVDPAASVCRELLTGVSRLRRRLRDTAGYDDLTPTQTSVLGVLAKHEPMTASDLAASERVRPQSMASTLAYLDDRGLIQRMPHPTDGRRHLVNLSPAGRDLVDGTRGARQDWLTREISRFDPHEQAVLAEAGRLMQRLAEV